MTEFFHLQLAGAIIGRGGERIRNIRCCNLSALLFCFTDCFLLYCITCVVEGRSGGLEGALGLFRALPLRLLSMLSLSMPISMHVCIV